MDPAVPRTWHADEEGGKHQERGEVHGDHGLEEEGLHILINNQINKAKNNWFFSLKTEI